MAIDTGGLGKRNSLLRRVQRHQAVSTIFRVVEDVPLASGVAPAAAGQGQRPVTRARLALPAVMRMVDEGADVEVPLGLTDTTLPIPSVQQARPMSEASGYVPTVAEPAAAVPPVQAVPQQPSFMTPPLTMAAVPPPQTPPTTRAVSRDATQPTAAPPVVQRQEVSQPAVPTVQAPVSGQSAPAPMLGRPAPFTPPVTPPQMVGDVDAPDDPFSKPEWDRLSTIMRKHEAKQAAGEDTGSRSLADRVDAPWLQRMAQKYEADREIKPTLPPHERPKPKMPQKSLQRRRRPRVEYVSDEPATLFSPQVANEVSGPAAEPSAVQREPETETAIEAKMPSAVQPKVTAPALVEEPAAVEQGLPQSGSPFTQPAVPEAVQRKTVPSNEVNSQLPIADLQVDSPAETLSPAIDVAIERQTIHEVSKENPSPSVPDQKMQPMETMQDAPSLAGSSTEMPIQRVEQSSAEGAVARQPLSVEPTKPAAASGSIAEEATPAVGNAPQKGVDAVLPEPFTAETAASSMMNTAVDAPKMIQREPAVSRSVESPTVVNSAPSSQSAQPAHQPQPAMDESYQPLPLQAVWPVKEVKAPPPMKPPELIEPMTITPSSQEKLRRAPEQDGVVRDHLAQVAAERTTDSSIELVLPRRARPAGLKPAPALQLQPDVPVQPPTIQREAAETAAPTMIETEVGALPSDLWKLIGQTPPQPASAAEPAGAAPAVNEQPPTAYIPAAPETVAQAPTQTQTQTTAFAPMIQRVTEAKPGVAMPASNGQVQPNLAVKEAPEMVEMIPQIQRTAAPAQGVAEVPAAVETPRSDEAEPQEQDTEAAAPDIDVDSLAREVYQALKRRLRLDRERNGRS